MSMEDMRRQHDVRSNAMIGTFHYGKALLCNDRRDLPIVFTVGPMRLSR